MLMSELFTKTRKEAPKDEVAKNAQLLIRAGFAHKEMAGVYSFLPLGVRVLRNIERIIRDEMNAIGGQEVLMTTLQDPAVWEKSGRWSDEQVDNWFKSHLLSGGEVGIANTHEEPLAALLRRHVASYADLPLYIYQIQTKFRNELRAKSGLLRGREFLMKDLYSFSRTEEEFRDYYETVAEAYMRIFEHVGIGHLVWRTCASGGSFSTFSDEFQVVCNAGEDVIYIAREKKIAVNKEVYAPDVLAKIGLEKETLEEAKAIEVGNIFPLGTRFPESAGLTYKDEHGKDAYPIMGSYGIGLGRLMGTIVETLADEKGIVWPRSIAPFTVHLITVNGPRNKANGFGRGRQLSKVNGFAENLYKKMVEANIDALYDDRDARAGMKFNDADLIGIPYQIIVSEKTMAKGEDVVEVKERKTGERRDMKIKDLLERISTN